MPTLAEEWAKYVAPFIKHPGCISKDPVVAAAHLTSCRWMEVMGHNHVSFASPERNVKMFERAILERCAKIVEEYRGDHIVAEMIRTSERTK
jgi:hypothetical protein